MTTGRRVGMRKVVARYVLAAATMRTATREKATARPEEERRRIVQEVRDATTTDEASRARGRRERGRLQWRPCTVPRPSDGFKFQISNFKIIRIVLIRFVPRAASSVVITRGRKWSEFRE